MERDKRMIMLIDDNEIDLKINAKLIELSNLFSKIIICQSGDEGLCYIRKHLKDATLLPNFILLDIQMPEMNGFEFLEQFKSLPESFKNTCRIAMLSSTLDFGDIKRSEANSLVTKLLRKPLKSSELREVVAQEIAANH